MSLFQKSVENKYLNELASALIDQKFTEFQAYFGNKEIQENIRNAKEEQFQEGFLRELFVKIFGYTLNPEPKFNLTTEFKNITNSKKADGAILKGDDAIAVIELKGTDITDLDKIETQAFGYKNHHPKCVYIITSNFEKLRFYIQNAVDHIDFNLFELNREQFALMWLCLAKDNLISDLPERIKDLSVLQEEDITKKLYADYSKFREAIYTNLVKNNPDRDKLLLFKKTQKLLDRFLFIFFAEDRLLLPPNSINEIVKQWTTLKDELDEYVPLYNRFKKFFSYMNTGFKSKKYEIFAFNGGLFALDEILDNINIDDDILHEHTVKLSAYNFETDIDVNILGHIFEHSLGEIENIQAEIKGVRSNNRKTKRKKDGIFYTPKYITKYIVENTVGKLCHGKQNELGIIDDEYAKGRKYRKKSTIKILDEKLTAYRDWLLTLTILDPACGSGAFLNQALEFLIEEHKKVDELRARLYGDSLIFTDITTDILEKNIYGVDLNEESVEIAKLSLWLRTAKKGRKLNTLSNNIKCGNSLIDDPEVAGEKAFNWQQEFPEIFNNNGFDVVIGNPPYGAEFNTLEKDYFKTYYSQIHVRTPESFNYFLLKIEHLINCSNGIWSVIIPSSFLNQHEFEKCRKYLADNSIVNQVLNLGDDIFQDVSTPTCIISISKNNQDTSSYADFQKDDRSQLLELIFDKNRFIHNVVFANNIGCSFKEKPYKNIIEKCYDNRKLKEIAQEVATGISSGKDKAYVFTQDQIDSMNLENALLKKLIVGGEINRYYKTPYSTKKIIYITSNDDISQYKNIGNLLIQYKNVLIKRREAANGKIKWYSLNWPRRKKLFDDDKILIRQTASRILACYDDESWYCLKSGIIVQLDNESECSYPYILSILNSKLFDFLYQDLVGEGSRIFPEVKPVQLFKLPIKIIDEENSSELGLHNQLVNLSGTIQGQYLTLVDLIRKFALFIDKQVVNNAIGKKLQKWHELEFSDFINEFNKVIKKACGKKLNKSDEMEWMELFETKKSEVQALISEIEMIDKEIDQIVYKLYGLSEEEIKIVDDAT